MLKSLGINNYILISSLETSFPEGLVIISGETGAGKSILLGALSLALGGKADASMVGPHGDNCVVEAVFSMSPAAQRFLQENDLPFDDEDIVIRRVVSKSGRSRSFLCDEPVQLGILQQLSSKLLDIHSQHSTQMLQEPSYRLEALDVFAGNAELLKEVDASWKDACSIKARLEEVREQRQRALLDEDYNKALYERLSEAKLREGELQELETEQKQLAHAEELRELLYDALQRLNGDESSPALEMRACTRLLEKASAYIPETGDLSQRLESARLEIEDIADEVESRLTRIDANPAKLEKTEERLSLLYSLMKKHGVSSVEELIEERERLHALVFSTEDLADEEKRLEGELEKALRQYSSRADELHSKRTKAVEEFGRSVMDGLSRLDMEGGVFKAELLKTKDGPKGYDSVSFLFSPSAAQVPADASKAASGGELSRIMLALKAVLSRHTSMPSLFFDEIDTGVSGSTAHKMGEMVCDMGKSMQVFAITHLPQVAAKGEAHYLVSKKEGETGIDRLGREDREREIARMLSGSSITAEALANAKRLLADG